ncbi:MAG: succinyl-diaminopimelate desuccinylase [Bauldia sp.]
MTVADPVEIARALLRCRSVTPADDGAQDLLAGILTGAGFSVARKTFTAAGTPDVANLLATIGNGPPHLVFAGHTDVVPAGDERRWTHRPFQATVAGGVLYGRGAVDMKGGIACFLAAALAFVGERPAPGGTLSLVVTGDEEGPAINGTAKLIDWAFAAGHRFDAAVIGEPTSRRSVGDTIKIGRRGSLSASIRVTGRQGHVAYPDLADNPIPRLVRIVDRLAAGKLDDGSADFSPSHLEITSIDVGNPTFNVIPGEASARFNARFNDRWSAASLEEHLRREVAAAGGDARAELSVERASNWFLSPRAGPLVDLISEAVRSVTGASPQLSTTGGTSDARFFKDLCPVVEIGLVGETIHQVDERVPLADLEILTAVYRAVLDRFFTAGRR